MLPPLPTAVESAYSHEEVNPTSADQLDHLCQLSAGIKLESENTSINKLQAYCKKS